ncbi:MAG: YIP1 family protein [Paracoccaceae bacterium]|nr:YIP1 family protein [Paracoccaceae bacterium]
MDVSLSGLLDLARFTVRRPREGAAKVLSLDLPIGARWGALGLMAVISALLVHFSFNMQSADIKEYFEQVMGRPIGTALLQGVVLVISVFLIHFGGRLVGGRGRFEDAVVLVAWLQFILLCLQVVQLAVQMLAPPVADLIGLGGLGLFLWLLTNFVAELHGFSSLLRVFGGIVITFVVMVMVLSLVLAAVFGGAAVGA